MRQHEHIPVFQGSNSTENQVKAISHSKAPGIGECISRTRSPGITQGGWRICGTPTHHDLRTLSPSGSSDETVRLGSFDRVYFRHVFRSNRKKCHPGVLLRRGRWQVGGPWGYTQHSVDIYTPPSLSSVHAARPHNYGREERVGVTTALL